MKLWTYLRSIPERVASIHEIRARRRQSADICRVLEATLDSVTYQLSKSQSYGGDKNRYTHKKTLVTALRRAYRGESDWGCGLVKTIIDYHTAFLAPSRLQITAAEEGQDAAPEIEFIHSYLRQSRLDRDQGMALIRLGLFEGQLALHLHWNAADQRVVVKPLDWESYQYVVRPVDPNDPAGPRRLTWTGTRQTVTLEDDDFSFASFGSEPGAFRGVPAITGQALMLCENINQAVERWRKINDLFAIVTPFFKAADQATAAKIRDTIKANGWKLGQAFAANADLLLKSPESTSKEMLAAEIENDVKLLSGITGVPIFHLGFSNVLSNRATADAMGEPVEIVSQAGRTGWNGFYEEHFNDVIRLRNRHLHGQLRENVLRVGLKPPTDRQWDHVKDVWLPALQQGLDWQTFLEQVPDVGNVEQILGRIDQAGAQRLEAERHLESLATQRLLQGADT